MEGGAFRSRPAVVAVKALEGEEHDLEAGRHAGHQVLQAGDVAGVHLAGRRERSRRSCRKAAGRIAGVEDAGKLGPISMPLAPSPVPAIWAWQSQTRAGSRPRHTAVSQGLAARAQQRGAAGLTSTGRQPSSRRRRGLRRPPAG